MQRRLNKSLISILLIVCVPLVLTILVYFLDARLQPQKIYCQADSAVEGTFYFDEELVYALDGEIGCVPCEIIAGDNSGSTMYEVAKNHPGYCTINSLSDALTKDFLVDDTYTGTLFFSVKLPANEHYSFIFPAIFCNRRIYINQTLVSHSELLKGNTPVFPTSAIIEFPYEPSGLYEIALQISSPENYIYSASPTILFGTTERVSKVYDNMIKSSLCIIFIIAASIILCLIQLFLFKHNKVLFSFIFFSLSAALCIAISDDSILMVMIPAIPYYVGVVIRAIATPLFMVNLINITASLFPENFPKRLAIVLVSAQLIPLISSMCLNSIPMLVTLTKLVTIMPFALCLYVFYFAYEEDKRQALAYGLAILLTETGILIGFATSGYSVPARYNYSFGYIAFAIVIVIIISTRYSMQYKEELFFKNELAHQLEAMQASENAFLNAQMKPHFLYNTLNTIADLCVTDPEKAKRLIASLEEYLKLILNLDNMDETVPLRRELELAEIYSDIEKERFPSINFYKDYPMRMPAIMMPPLTIQPLIENAIKHGVRKSGKPGVVTLRITEAVDSVTFFVSDNGAGMTPETISKLFEVPKENKSIGIYNIDKRLKNKYNHGLNVESTPGLGTCVSFTIPKV